MIKKIFILTILSFVALIVSAQEFEEAKLDPDSFEKLKVRVGADFALQFQGLDHSADSTLIPLGRNVNLPTANFNISADLAPGIQVNLITYLSSRHHPEAWVKGGYLLIDRLPFINSDFLNRIMEISTLKAGVMEVNYGDAHFRRSDNGRVIDNPFVGNYVMDAFTTAPALEAMMRTRGWTVLGGISTGSLRPDLVRYSSFSDRYTSYNIGEELAVYTKLGYDKQFSEDFRIRGTVSGYYNGNHHFGSLYYGDRAGSRYYLVMNRQTGSSDDVDPSQNHTSSRWGPGFTDKNQAFMVNLFTRFHGLEFFGTYERTAGTGAFSGAEYGYSQFAAELIYRFGNREQFYGGGKLNKVSNDKDQDISRFQIGAGWLITENIIFKAEYVNQGYNNFSDYGQDAGFNGLMLEAGISF